MTDQRFEELKAHYLSKKDKSEKMLMYEFLNHVKHEARMNTRERRRGDIETRHQPV
jgi:hypothetical protein